MNNASSKLTLSEFLRGYAPLGLTGLVGWTIGCIIQHRVDATSLIGLALILVGGPLLFWICVSAAFYFIETRPRRRLHKAVAALSTLTPEEVKAGLRAHLLANGYTEVIDYGTTTTVEYRKLPPLGEEGDRWLPAKPAS